LKVQLQFAELYHDAIEGAVFDVTVEGLTVLSDYDVLAAAGSKGTAHIEDVSTIVKDGELNLDFASSVYGAQVAAIKVVRDTIPSVSGTTDPTLCQSERMGDFSYELPLSNGDYEVVLSFCESTYAESGKRVFDVEAEGIAVLSDYDIYSEAGAVNTLRTEVIPVTILDGQLDLAFNATVGEASLSAIKIVDTSTSSVVLAVNVGGSADTAVDSTDYVAEFGYGGGTARFPGQAVVAINSGGDDYTATDGTFYAADDNYTGGYAYNGALNRVRVTMTRSGTDEVYDYDWTTEPATGEFSEATLTHPGGLKTEGKSVVYSQDRQSYVDTRTLRGSQGSLVSKMATYYETFPFGERATSEVLDPDGAALTTTWSY